MYLINLLTALLLIPTFSRSNNISISRVDLNTIKKICTYHIGSNKLIYDCRRDNGRIILMEGGIKTIELYLSGTNVILLRGKNKINLSTAGKNSIDKFLSPQASRILSQNLFASTLGPQALNKELKDKYLNDTWGKTQASTFKKIYDYIWGECKNTETCECELQTVTRDCKCGTALICISREIYVCTDTPQGTNCTLQIRCHSMCS